MNLTFDIDPQPASRPRVTRWGTYYKPTYTQFKKDMAVLIRQYPRVLIDTPVQVVATFYLPIAKSTSKKKRAEMNGTYCVVNGDLDNLEKALYDSMNDYIWVDDKQVVAHSNKKVWIDGKGRIDVLVTKL